MTQNGAAANPETGKPTVYRGPTALICGVLMAVFCLFGTIDLIVEAGARDLFGAAILLVLAVLAVIYGPYPAAFSGDSALRVRNPFRTIELPWSQVTGLTARLSFIVEAGGRRFTVWAVPVSMHDRRKIQRQRLKSAAQANRPTRRGRSAAADAFEQPRPSDRIEQLSFADQAVAEMSSRRDQYVAQVTFAARTGSAAGAAGNGTAGGTGAGTGEGMAETATPTVRWSPAPFAAIAAAVLFALVALIVK